MRLPLPPRTPRWKRQIRAVLTMPVRVKALRESAKVSVTEINEFTLTIRPTVFHPALYQSSRILAEVLSDRNLSGKCVLDMGTGSGIIALHAARGGANVVGVDVNPEAVACARENVRANGYETWIRVVEGDLFSFLRGEKFDTIVWNPPFYVGDPRNPEQKAWLAGQDYQKLQEFASQLPLHLKDGGECIVILSSDADMERIIGFFDRNILSPVVLSNHRRFLEVYSVISLRRA
jgi:release factor glutamine methyltransferase